MIKTRSALRLGGALAIALAFLLSFSACSETPRTPDDDSVSETITDYSDTVEVKLGGLTAKALTVNSGSYDLVSSNKLYWTYTAVKADGYFTTGETEEETDLNDGEPGLPSSLPGTYSVGAWVFTFNAYAPTTDDDGNETKGDLYYEGIATSADLYSSKTNTVAVNVQFCVSGDTGSLVVYGISIPKSSDSDETVSADDIGAIVYTLVSDSASLSGQDSSLAVFSESAEDGLVFEGLSSGVYTLTLYVYTTDLSLLTSGQASVVVKPELQATITGTLEESDDDLVSVSISGTYITVGDSWYVTAEDGSLSEVYAVIVYNDGEEIPDYYYLDTSESSFSVSSISKTGYTLLSLTDSSGNEYVDESSITLSESMTLYATWSGTFILSATLKTMKISGTTDVVFSDAELIEDTESYEGDYCYLTATLTPASDDGTATASSETVSYSSTVSSTKTEIEGITPGTYTLTVAVYDAEDDSMTLFDSSGYDLTDSDGETVEVYTAEITIASASTLVSQPSVTFYPSKYLEFIVYSDGFESGDLFQYLDDSTDTAVDTQWGLEDFTVYTKESTSSTDWTTTTKKANSLSGLSGGTVVKIKMMDHLVFPYFSISKNSTAFGVSKITELPVLGYTPDEACTNLAVIDKYDSYRPMYYAGPLGGSRTAGKSYIESVPEDIFKNNPQLTDFSFVFYNCNNLTEIPEGIFKYCPDATDFSCAFAYSALESIPAGLFASNAEASDFAGVFSGCESITEIPEGLFASNAKATTFYFITYGGPFYGTSITSIPDNLFSTEAEASLQGVFMYCTELTEINENAFKGLTKVTSLSSAFYGCTGITSIPEGLFSDCTSATSFSSVFRECTSLESIPEKLFSGLSKATNFAYAFYGCTSLESIPTGLFNSCESIQSIDYLFYNCTSLASIEKGIFSGNCESITSLSGLFYGCSALTSVPSDIFTYLPNVTTFSSVFTNCTGLESLPSELFSSFTGVTSFASVFSGCTGLKSLPEGLFASNTAVTSFASTFKNCTGLESLPDDLFAYNTAATSFEATFYGCTSLAAVPSGLFSGSSSATTFKQVFYGCTSLTSIESGLFSEATSATTFQEAFRGCTSLTSIPSGLFDSNTAVTSFASTFYGCSSVTSIPSGLFTNNTAVTSFASTFYNCSGITEIPSSLFDNNTAVTSFSSTFYGCSSLTSIPSGLFDNNTAVTSFASTFYNCSGIKEIPSGLFDSNTAVTNFASTFYGWTGLTSIPEGLFDNNTAVTSFASTFYNCSALTAVTDELFSGAASATSFNSTFYGCSSLETIGTDVFTGCTAVTDFERTFYGCSALKEIPEGLFDDCAAATLFGYSSTSSYYSNYGTFYGCSSLTSIPEGLFDNNTKATSFGGTFYGCSALTSVPDGLFTNNTAATNFQYLFYGCSSLESIPEDLFAYNTKVTTFHSTFRNCTSLTPVVYIGTESLTSKAYAAYFAYNCKETATIYVKNSTISGYFSNASSSNVSVTVPDDWDEAISALSSST